MRLILGLTVYVVMSEATKVTSQYNFNSSFCIDILKQFFIPSGFWLLEITANCSTLAKYLELILHKELMHKHARTSN